MLDARLAALVQASMRDEEGRREGKRVWQEGVRAEAAERRHRLGQAHHLGGGSGGALLVGAGHELGLGLGRQPGRALDRAAEVDDGAVR